MKHSKRLNVNYYFGINYHQIYSLCTLLLYKIKYKIDIFVMGDDWKGKFDYLSDLCKVVYLPRTPDISTSLVKKYLNYAK